jgi:membrane associated rhomboid family serine protease
MGYIDSESQFIWKFILKIILTPYTLLLVLFHKKEFSELFEPFNLLFHFLFQAKLTILLILINIIIFIASLFVASVALSPFMMYPQDLFSLRAYSLITAGFLHANITHLLGNMLALLIFGRVVERKLGLTKTAVIYFGALILSGIFSSLIDIVFTGSNVPGLGASGAIMGLVAAAILIDPLYLTYELILPLPIMVVGWLTIYADITGIINPTADGIGHFAHLGGFLSIAVLIFLLHKNEQADMKKGFFINMVSLVVFAAIYFFFLS